MFNGEEYDEDTADLIREQRLASEFCGWCHTRHHPEDPCQEEDD